MDDVTIDFLVTTVGQSVENIIKLINESGITGNVIVGNQKASDNSVKKYELSKVSLTIVNQTDSGTSKNRNRIFKYTTSDYVTFWDDDMTLEPDSINKIKKTISLNTNFNAVRFNSLSNNQNRPIKIIKKSKKCSFFDLKSFGVCGIFFKRNVLIKQNLTFNEKIGPGTMINHGEDSVFLKKFLTLNKYIYNDKNIYFKISQENSCWFNNDSQTYWISQGCIYRLMFGKMALLYGFINLMKNKTSSVKFSAKLRYFKEGMKIANSF